MNPKLSKIAYLVLKLAFPGAGSERDVEALARAQESAAPAVDLVLPLVRADGPLRVSTSVLIFGRCAGTNRRIWCVDSGCVEQKRPKICTDGGGEGRGKPCNL